MDLQVAFEVLQACIDKKRMNFVDIEPEDMDFVNKVKQLVQGTDTKLILTRQDYCGVADADIVLQTAVEIEQMQPDLVRMLYLAVDDVDMLHIAQAAKKAKLEQKLSVPFSISAIGEAGLMVRLFSERCGNRYLSCIMVKEGSQQAILKAAKEVMQYHPDIVEWRLDYVDHMLDIDFTEKILCETAEKLAEVVKGATLLMTFCIKEQGGLRPFPRDLRLRMVNACIRTGKNCCPSTIRRLQKSCLLMPSWCRLVCRVRCRPLT